MKLFPGMRHPDDVAALPSDFAAWALQFARIESEVEQELADREARKHRP